MKTESIYFFTNDRLLAINVEEEKTICMIWICQIKGIDFLWHKNAPKNRSWRPQYPAMLFRFGFAYNRELYRKYIVFQV